MTTPEGGSEQCECHKYDASTVPCTMYYIVIVVDARTALSTLVRALGCYCSELSH